VTKVDEEDLRQAKQKIFDRDLVQHIFLSQHQHYLVVKQQAVERNKEITVRKYVS
jgi:hypothetical protein